jgi:1,4-alpha-glucan branching enzyme
LVQKKSQLLGPGTSLKEFAAGHLYFGFHLEETSFTYREWAPAAQALFLIGDFNQWDRSTHPLFKNKDGHWEIKITDPLLIAKIKSGSLFKVHVVTNQNALDRVPLFARYVGQDAMTHEFSAKALNGVKPFAWKTAPYQTHQKTPFIYEAHVGMSGEEPKISTYQEFTKNILPRIAKAGYNTIQLMGIMEHPYYASFGYQVSNFFAPSSRFGTPDDLKHLIDTAHAMNLNVLLDVVHSHAVKNINEGMDLFDGTPDQFFHAGPKGDHPAWGTKLFNYGKNEVLHYLLSNVRYWLEEFHFDGFRFDGVTSMLYHHHGLGENFDHYSKYFGLQTDTEAITYLQLASLLSREINPQSILIAEDMSGMPGMALPVEQGGLGFDYRLAMGIPDLWFKFFKNSVKDEDWDLNQIWHELTSRRPQEKNIAYAESHDQALVGDKTIAFHLMDAAMYYHMHKDDQNLMIERGMALHKMIRLVTAALGGEGYLNFMGNEFGHPEWIDFPREGNQNSFHYARRQWSLVDHPQLKYQFLNTFDEALVRLLSENQTLSEPVQKLWLDNLQKIMAFKKGDKLFVFNFHPTQSYVDFFIPTHTQDRYQVLMSTDEGAFGGQSRVSQNISYQAAWLEGQPAFTGFKIYVPQRTAIVLEKI